MKQLLTRLGLELHPEKTRQVDLTRGAQSFDFLGCTLRKKMSGPIWERSRKRVYYLQREPSKRSMVRIRSRVRELTPRARCHEDMRAVIGSLNPVLDGWGEYFRTGNAAEKFVSVDGFVVRRLRAMLVKRKGRQLRAGQPARWNRDYFEAFGLTRLRGTIRYPEAA